VDNCSAAGPNWAEFGGRAVLNLYARQAASSSAGSSRRRLRRRVRRSPRQALPWEARPARPRRPGPIAALANSPAPAGRGYAVFLGFDCPDRGHRVQGGPAGRRMRSATPTLDPASTHLVLAPTRKAGTEQLIGDIQPPDLLSC
jgi:hypothetical protein